MRRRWRAAPRETQVQFVLCWAGIIVGSLLIVIAVLGMDLWTVGLLAAGGLLLGPALYVGLR